MLNVILTLFVKSSEKIIELRKLLDSHFPSRMHADEVNKARIMSDIATSPMNVSPKCSDVDAEVAYLKQELRELKGDKDHLEFEVNFATIDKIFLLDYCMYLFLFSHIAY